MADPTASPATAPPLTAATVTVGWSADRRLVLLDFEGADRTRTRVALPPEATRRLAESLAWLVPDGAAAEAPRTAALHPHKTAVSPLPPDAAPRRAVAAKSTAKG